MIITEFKKTFAALLIFLCMHNFIQSAQPEKLLQCPDCPKKYAYRGALASHQKRYHSETYPYYCSTCNEAYKRKSCLLKHEISKHGSVSSLNTTKIQKQTPRKSTRIQERSQKNASLAKKQLSANSAAWIASLPNFDQDYTPSDQLTQSDFNNNLHFCPKSLNDNIAKWIESL